MTHKFIPPHLRKFIVEQHYGNYTAIDHAVWRFIMRISKAFFEKYAHVSYLDGLKKTGITIDRIPHVNDMDYKLSKFGWGAVCVRGFIPPAAFMELQSRGILAIAADMRTLNHLTYTPAPDIVHEAAGHAPILADPDYAAYLHHYGEVSSKAISSRDDYNLYLAIRELSDVKEDAYSSEDQIQKAESDLETAIENFDYVSEAAYLARMNWWTVEYGLVGKIDDPKIYGAGLLSSVGESQNCLTDKVQKIRFSLDCINTSYDITEPQPQLFVTPDFGKLSEVLEEMAETMAFRLGGAEGLEKAKEAGTVCTAEYNSKVQISGILKNIIIDNDGNPAYLQYDGPTQLSRYGNEFDDHGGDYHSQGFGSPVGNVKGFYKPLCDFNDDDIEKINLRVDERLEIHFDSGVLVNGKLTNILQDNGRILILSFENCTVSLGEEFFFLPEWGMYDMTCGGSITSVYGGPADYDNYQQFLPDDKPKNIKMSSKLELSNSDIKLNDLYLKVREIREGSVPPDIDELATVYSIVTSEYPEDWLLSMQLLELGDGSDWADNARNKLEIMADEKSDLGTVIKRGLALL
ncbi:MAG: aromatic amino acid hydroxylase [Candidatus Marinimicrobia bacterium]|nr:aromatic amino acid hydroxylase [Candidatus Neomarinimicrobiota bacterium]MBT7377646.1 aromatic amino acid hydroxylase [Candidatus Neomarinimicrobiota bacterium]